MHRTSPPLFSRLFLLFSLLSLVTVVSIMSSAQSTGGGGDKHILSTPLPAAGSKGWKDEGAVQGSSGTMLGSSAPQTPAQPLKMDFRVLLRQNKEAIERQLQDVSDPVRAAHNRDSNSSDY